MKGSIMYISEVSFRVYYPMFINPLPDNKILNQTKLKAFADDKCTKNDNF